MCGIIGYIGKKEAYPFLMKGLKKLEYRGYDSAGIAVLSSQISIQKDKGRLEDICFDETAGNIGIAHTRWATHGSPKKENAHPHLGCKEEVAVVHNGIIENYKEIKENLVEKGHIFKSDTDSEVISHLIEEFSLENFEKAFIKALRMLKGSYAILAIKRGERKILGARRGSPSLLIGIAPHGIFPSSDVLAFLGWANKVVYLKRGDVFLGGDDNESLKIYNLDEDRIVERSIDTVKYDTEEAKKGEFEHFMLKEISEQDETVLRAIQQDVEVVEDICNEIRKAVGVFFVGCGSSFNACLAGSYLFSKIAKAHMNVVLASEFDNYEHFLMDKTLVFAVSQSGETADVLEAVEAAKKRGSKVIGIVNRVESSLTRDSDRFMMMNTGLEICVLSTKTYTAQVVLMSLLAYALAGKYEEGLRKLGGLYLDIYNLTSRSMREHLRELAEILYDKNHVYLIGRGLQYATALEAALKIKEVSYIHAEALAGGELKHGTLALIEDGTPCIVFVSRENKSKILANAEEIKSRGGYIIGVSAERSDIFDFWVKVPEVEELNSIVQVIPMQVLAYELAVLRSLNPDKPRNLAKSVTVT